SLRLLPDVDHWQAKALGDPGGEGDAGGLAAGDNGDTLEPDRGLDPLDGQIDDPPPGAGKADDPAAVDIDGRKPAGGQAKRIGRPKMHGPDLEQNAGNGTPAVGRRRSQGAAPFFPNRELTLAAAP